MSATTENQGAVLAPDIIDALLYGVFHGIDRSDVEVAVARTAHAVADLLDEVAAADPPAQRLERAGSTRLRSGWDLPDAVWRELRVAHPDLAVFPTGLAAERAVKRTVAGWVSIRSRAGRMPRIETAWAAVMDAHRTLGADGVRETVATEFLYELCVDQLRRTGRARPSDLAFWYHFGHSGRMVASVEQEHLRARIRAGCERRAADFVAASTAVEQRSNVTDRINVVGSGTSMAALNRQFEIVAEPLRVGLHTRTANVSFKVEKFEQELMAIAGRPGCRIHSLVRDLLDIATVTDIADLHVRRERNLARQLGILVPVVHDDLWSDHARLLADVVGGLGRDDVTYSFAARRGTANPPQAISVQDDDRCVCLFSGGLDSLAGAVWALNEGKEPVFVSHHVSGNLAGMQANLIAHLAKTFRRELPHVNVYLSRSHARKVQHRLPRPPASVMAQYLRTFLFLALGAATALELGIRTVYVFEHGPTAINPQVSEARINTRNTHPHFLAGFAELVRRVFGVEIRFENPFLYMTKGEVTEVLDRPATQRLLAESVSCWTWFRVPLMAKQRGLRGHARCHHDGECIPCLIRRAGVHQAGLDARDATYLTDVFSDFPAVRKETVIMLADNLRFAQEVQALPDAALLDRVPELSVADADTDSARLVDMYRRHSAELLACFADEANDELRQVFASVLR